MEKTPTPTASTKYLLEAIKEAKEREKQNKIILLHFHPKFKEKQRQQQEK